MKGLPAKKIGMTQVFDPDGKVTPVTVIQFIDPLPSEDGFQVGSKVHVTGTSIGKGFAGTIKRHHFSGGPASHGSKQHRLPGSSGSGTGQGRVFPGSRREGHMGGERVTQRNLHVVQVDSENQLVLLRGAVPGYDEGKVWVRKAA